MKRRTGKRREREREREREACERNLVSSIGTFASQSDGGTPIVRRE